MVEGIISLEFDEMFKEFDEIVTVKYSQSTH